MSDKEEQEEFERRHFDGDDDLGIEWEETEDEDDVDDDEALGMKVDKDTLWRDI